MSETDSEPKDKSDVYRERNLLALAFILSEARATQAYLSLRGKEVEAPVGWWPDTDDVNGEAWAVVWCNLPTGQVGWHVPREMVPDWLPKRDPEYDGYSTDEKNRRLAEWADIPTEED